MLESVYKDGKSYHNEDQGFPVYRMGDKKFAYYTYSYSPLRDDNGNIGGVMVTSIETTSKIESFRKLEESEQIARLALESAEMGSFEYDLISGIVTASESHSRILGVNRTQDSLDYRKIYVQEDLRIRDQAHKNALKTGKLDYIARFNVHGKIRWIQALGKVIYDKENVPIKMIGVVQDITEKKLIHEKLLQANKKLQQSNKEQKILQKQKDQFLQIASHELRTPVTAIKGFAQLVKEILEEKGHIKESRMVEKLNLRIDHLHSLLENLFDVSKINSGKMDFKDQVEDLSVILKEIVDNLRFTPLKHTITEEYSFTALVNVDKDRISQVINNLLSNAIKYSPEGKEIKIRTRKLEQFIAVDIEDQGMGIDPDEVQQIFEQFYRSKNIEDSGIRGLGLGLFLSSQIIHRTGGEIWVESELGKGSTFTFTLPIYEQS
jgi:PAS domain S-box-containing protein